MNKRRLHDIHSQTGEEFMKEIDIQSKKNSKNNKISTQTCSILGLPARSLLECCSFGNMIWFLFIISIQLTPMIQEVSLKLSVSLLLFIIFLAKITKNSLTLRNQINHDAIINSSEYAIFRDPDFEIRPSMNIVEGDTNTHPSFLQNFNFYKFTFPTFLGDNDV